MMETGQSVTSTKHFIVAVVSFEFFQFADFVCC